MWQVFLAGANSVTPLIVNSEWGTSRDSAALPIISAASANQNITNNLLRQKPEEGPLFFLFFFFSPSSFFLRLKHNKRAKNLLITNIPLCSREMSAQSVNYSAWRSYPADGWACKHVGMEGRAYSSARCPVLSLWKTCLPWIAALHHSCNHSHAAGESCRKRFRSLSSQFTVISFNTNVASVKQRYWSTHTHTHTHTHTVTCREATQQSPRLVSQSMTQTDTTINMATVTE